MIENYKEKKTKTDILLDISNSRINIEMNNEYYEGLFQKNNAYQNKLIGDQFLSGQGYEEVKKVIQINFDNFNRFDERVIIKFQIMDKECGIVEDTNYEKYHIILPNVEEKYYNKEELDKFSKELLILTTEDKEKLKSLVGKDDILMKAKEKLEDLSEDTDIMGLYDGEKMDEFERIAKERYAGKLGYEKGIKEGIKEGIEKEKISIINNMLNSNIDLETISKVTGYSLSQIEEIRNNL